MSPESMTKYATFYHSNTNLQLRGLLRGQVSARKHPKFEFSSTCFIPFCPGGRESDPYTQRGHRGPVFPPDSLAATRFFSNNDDAAAATSSSSAAVAGHFIPPSWSDRTKLSVEFFRHPDGAKPPDFFHRWLFVVLISSQAQSNPSHHRFLSSPLK